MKKFVMSMACVLAIVLGLCACGDGNAKAENAESSAASSITLKKDGSIESRLAVEGFGTDYSEESLENLIDASISE
ncbi:MAG: hypothetical protein K2P35_06090, partial [Lachnospiraceae bacterium]|nr:hypothetical protein [Lachnospiraceae bacterium]